jgi:hypothetical protein
MKTSLLNSTMVAFLTLAIGLLHSQPATAASHVFQLSPTPSTVLTHASTCYKEDPPVGVPSWPQLYYAAFRKSSRARGLRVRQWVWTSVGGSPYQWFEFPTHDHYTWNDTLAIYNMPYYGGRTEFYVLVSVPKVGLVAYRVGNPPNPIPNVCG